MPGYLQSHQISPRPSQNHCLPLFHVLPGEGGAGGITSATRSQDIALWRLGLCCQQATHHFWLGCRLVAGFGAGLVHGGSRALRTRENWHFVECTCITAPEITCDGPWPWVAFLCGPLGSGKWPGHQGARGCGEPQSQRGSLILYETGEVPRCKLQPHRPWPYRQ